MKSKKVVILLSFTLLTIIPLTVQAASLNASTTPNIPWTRQSILAGSSFINLSTGFVGDDQVPLLIYAKSGESYVYEVFHETASVSGNCGVDNAWVCQGQYIPLGLNVNTLSEVAIYNHYSESPVKNSIGYLYERDNYIYALKKFFGNDMIFYEGNQIAVIQLDKFGTLVGVPSLQYDMNGNERAAITVNDGGIYKLVYMYYTGAYNTSCIDTSSPYQCDVIDSSPAAMGEPSLSMSSAGTETAIAYTKASSLYFATECEEFVANCGPGGTSWRCKFIHTAGPDSFIVDGVDLEMNDLIQIAYLEDRTDMNTTSLNLANYVFHSGNCGEDSDWDCQTIQTLGDDGRDYDFSLQIEDADTDYSVIAYSYFDDALSLGLAYPKERTGETSGNCENTDWICQLIAGSSGGFLPASNGALASLALNDSGLGLIGYLETVPLVQTHLNVAFQEQTQMEYYLPLIKN